MAEHWEHVAEVPQELASGTFPDHDNVVAVDLRIFQASSADVLEAEECRNLLVADVAEHHDIIEISGGVGTSRGSDRLLQRHLADDRIVARLADRAVNREG